MLMKTYDIVLDDNNELAIDVYSAKTVRDGKEANYLYGIFATPEDIRKYISDLRKEGAFSLTRLQPTDFRIIDGSIPYNIQSLILPLRHKLLEKVYDEVIIDGVCHVFTHVTYINVYTGEIFSLKVNDLGIYSEELESSLEENGYKHIGSSFLGKYLDGINSQKNMPHVLNRRK